MKIGIISDTHGSVPAWHKAMKLFADADLILHAGDILYHPPRIIPGEGYDIPELVRLINECPVPVVIARGNCDAEVYEELLQAPVLSPYAFVQFEGLRIVVTHGHNLTSEQMAQVAGKYRANVFVTGHTHLPVVERMGGAIHINPGSPTYPKLERGGVLIPTVGMISGGCARIIELDSGIEIVSLPLM